MSPISIPGLQFFPTFLDDQQQAWLLEWIRARADSEWAEVRFRGVVARRRMLCFGWDYVTTGRGLRETTPLPVPMLRLRDAAARCAGLADADDLQQLIISDYPPAAGIGVHIDAPVFGEPILGISLGGAARMRFSRKGQPNQTLLLPSGTLYVLGGEARWQWFHQIMPVAAQRYSFTFRKVVAKAAA